MPTSPAPGNAADPAKASPPLLHEADIGSGEKTPADAETEEMIRQIPPLPEDTSSGQQQRQQEQQQQQQAPR